MFLFIFRNILLWPYFIVTPKFSSGTQGGHDPQFYTDSTIYTEWISKEYVKLGEKGEGAERSQRGGSGGFENTFYACMKFSSNSILKKEAVL